MPCVILLCCTNGPSGDLDQGGLQATVVLSLMMGTKVTNKAGAEVPQYIWASRRGVRIQVVNPNYTRLVNAHDRVMRASKAVIYLNMEVHACA